jgi:hypothetical protein
MEKRFSGWKRELLRVHGLIAGLFARSEVRERCLAYLQGLLSGCERKNGRQLAEWMGDASPYAMQHLLDRARWDADLARDRVRSYAIEELRSADAVLIVDETGFLKKGLHSAGVKRQYTGTAGRIENSQVGVFLCYGSNKGAALVDRELYIPQEWAEDRERRRESGIPDTVEFATKPELARRMIGRALDSGAAATQAIATTSLTQNHAATAFTPVTGAGGTAPLSYSVSPALPTGLSISSSTGAITGTPTATSSARSYTVTVTDAGNATATATFSLTVSTALTATQAIATTTLTRTAS